MTGKIVIAQIGCGYWGPNLLRNFYSLPGCTVKWVAEVSEARRQFVGANFPGVQTTDVFAQAIEDPAVDAVIVATPAATHFELARAALLAGKHVFVEKPLATRTVDADELIALAARQNRVLMVGHTFLFNPAVEKLRDMLSAKELGDLFYIYCQRLNLGQLRKDVNAWWNLAPHDLAILVHLMDEEMPVSITASGMAYLQPGIEDVVFATVKWANGIAGHIHVSWLDPGKVRKLTFVGSRKMVVYDDIADSKLAIYDKGFDRVPRIGEQMSFDDPLTHTIRMRSGDIVLPFIPNEEPLKREAKHFIQCIVEGKEPLAGPQHARKIVALLEAGELSMKSGREVALAAGPAAPSPL